MDMPNLHNLSESELSALIQDAQKVLSEKQQPNSACNGKTTMKLSGPKAVILITIVIVFFLVFGYILLNMYPVIESIVNPH